MAGRPKRRRKMRRMNRKRFQNYYNGQEMRLSGSGYGTPFLFGILAAFAYRRYQKMNAPVEVIVLNPEEDLM